MDVVGCSYELFPKTWQGPAEYCPEDAEPGLEFCSDHIPWEPDDVDWRRERDYDNYCE